MIMSEPISDANFIDTGKVFVSNGEKAYALYCSDCLAYGDVRTKDPKSALDKQTLEEFSLDRLVGEEDASSATKEKQQQPSQSLQQPQQQQELETENH
jgi:hypothetical protein